MNVQHGREHLVRRTNRAGASAGLSLTFELIDTTLGIHIYPLTIRFTCLGMAI
jgi:hypothetical protein